MTERGCNRRAPRGGFSALSDPEEAGKCFCNMGLANHGPWHLDGDTVTLDSALFRAAAAVSPASSLTGNQLTLHNTILPGLQIARPPISHISVRLHFPSVVSFVGF